MDNNSKTLTKNTIAIYIKMFFLLAVGFYSSRITINSLGEYNYGLYNTVAGIVIVFQFFYTSFTGGVQRYLNYYLGKNDENELKKIFSISFYTYLFIAIIVLILSETIGLYVFNNYMFIKEESRFVASLVYQLSIISAFFSIIQLPFNASIIAYEKLGFYAFIGIFDGLLRLAIPFALLYIDGERLLLYSFLILLSIVLQTIVYIGYSVKNFSIVNFTFYKDKKLLIELLTFSGWNIIGHLASSLSTQCIGLFINHFFLSIFDGAISIANTLNGYLFAFLSNFQTVFNPQIIKIYAQDDIEHTNELVYKMSKYSFMIIFFIILPFLVNYDFVVSLWLGFVPQYSKTFIILFSITLIVSALSGPFWMLVDAEGNIKKYEIVECILKFIAIVLMLILYTLKFSVYWGYIINILEEIVFAVWRIYYLKKCCSIKPSVYVSSVLSKCFVVTIISVPIVCILKQQFTNVYLSFFISCICSCIILGILYLSIMLCKEERENLFSNIKDRFVGLRHE